MDINFDFGADRGRVTAEVVPNDDPVSLGKGPQDRGMPVCTATIDFTARGYRAMLGWVQLVRLPETAGRFVTDPFDLFEDSTAPFAWYGVRPVLFDAPSRRYPGRVRWEAQSYLTVGPWDGDRRQVVPLAGFSWGYEQGPDGEPRITPARLLGPADWEDHGEYLAGSYPAWRFDTGGRLADQRI